MDSQILSMYFCKVVVSDIIERNATPKQKEASIDIADWIIFQIREGKVIDVYKRQTYSMPPYN